MNKTCLALALIAGAGACYAPNTAAIKAKFRDECRIAPSMPACAHGDEEVEDLFWNEFIYDRFDSAAEEQCVLDTDCDYETVPTETFLEAMSECSRQHPAIPRVNQLGSRDRLCLQACEQELLQCGGDECTLFEAQGCLNEREACKQDCPPG